MGVLGSVDSIVSTALALPIVIILAVFGLIALRMYLSHRERMMGWRPPSGSPPPDRDAWSWDRYDRDRSGSPLESALVMIGVGLGLFFGLLTMGPGPWLLAGLVVLFLGLVRFGMMAWGLEPMGQSLVPVPVIVRRGLYTSAIGLALLLGLSTLGSGPWLLAGAIPLGVGFARLATAALIARGWTQQ